MSEKKNIKNIKNYGVDIEREAKEQENKDWILGATDIKGLGDEAASLIIALYAWPNPVNGIYPRVDYAFNHSVIFWNRNFEEFYPAGEIQKGKEDFMDCVARAHNNEIEKQLNWLIENKKLSLSAINWLKEKNYYHSKKGIELSDRFPAILSNTTRQGNSLKAPIDAIRKYGCIPKSTLPANELMRFNDYHDRNDITQKMLELGQEFLKRIKINYARVNRRYFEKYAGNIKWEIFDNYEEALNDFVKRLAPDYNFYYYAYKIFINETGYQEPKPVNNKDMLKTIKFKTDPRIFIVSPVDGKKLLWIEDPRGDSWEDYKFMLNLGLIAPYEEISDALMSSYEILAGIIKTDVANTGNADWFSWFKRILNIFKK